ncbi:MAG: radical SAM protein [Bdellovibrionales bacterium]|nr:radical SAM protein [Bdellovibrionales bacterium]
MDIVYGPVKSQRYGSTLGINLLGAEKVCSYNCVYCSLGPTQLTMNKIRKDYVFPSLDQVRNAFKEYIKKSVPSEAVVVSGNGEPTLHAEFEEAMKLITSLRDEHLPGVKVVVLTNGAHLDNKKVVNGLNLADERVIKIDAGNDVLMQKFNDPLIRINMAKFLSGFRKLKDYTVQSLFCLGEFDNTAADAVDEWIEVLGMIKPKAVQICTLSRPSPAFPGLQPADEDALYGIAFKLKKRTSLEASVFSIQKT